MRRPPRSNGVHLLQRVCISDSEDLSESNRQAAPPRPRGSPSVAGPASLSASQGRNPALDAVPCTWWRPKAGPGRWLCDSEEDHCGPGPWRAGQRWPGFGSLADQERRFRQTMSSVSAPQIPIRPVSSPGNGFAQNHRVSKHESIAYLRIHKRRIIQF